MVKRAIGTPANDGQDSKPCPFLSKAEVKGKLVKPVAISEDAIKVENKKGTVVKALQLESLSSF